MEEVLSNPNHLSIQAQNLAHLWSLVVPLTAAGPTLSDRHVRPDTRPPRGHPHHSALPAHRAPHVRSGIPIRIRSGCESEATAPSLPVPAGRRPPFLPPLLLRFGCAACKKSVQFLGRPCSPTRPSSLTRDRARLLPRAAADPGKQFLAGSSRSSRAFPGSCRGIRRGSWLGLSRYPRTAAKARVPRSLIVFARFIPRHTLVPVN